MSVATQLGGRDGRSDGPGRGPFLRRGWRKHLRSLAVLSIVCAVRMDDSAVLAVQDANDRTGAAWRLSRRLVGGAQSGAWRLESDQGISAVLKLAATPDWTNQVLRADLAVASVRSVGYPTPAWTTVGQTPTGVGYQVQEVVEGQVLDVIGVAEARELIKVLELQRDLDPDPDRCWSDFLAAEVTSGLPALRAGAVAAGDAGQDLAAACDRLLDPLAGEIAWPRADMVHGDFRLANILFQHGTVAGVIDIEAIGSGTRVFDYATLLDHSRIDPGALELLVETAVGIAGSGVLRACFAWVALDLARFMAATTLPNAQEHLDNRVRELTGRVIAVDRLSGR